MNRRIVIKVLAFVALVFAIDRGLYAVLSAAYPHIGAGLTEGMVNASLAARAEVVVLGHSRARRDYDTRVLRGMLHRSAYNLGALGQGLPYDRGTADILLKHYTPELVIVHVEPESILFRQDAFDRVSCLAPFMNQSEVVRELIYDRRRHERVKYLLKSFQFNSKLLPMVYTWWNKDPTIDGFLPSSRRMTSTKTPEESEPDDTQTTEPDPDLIRMLRDLIHSVQRAGSRIVLADAPRYRASGRRSPGTIRLHDVIREIAEAEGTHYIVISQESDPAFCNPDLFFDAGHLNEDGAELFTRMLVDQLRTLGHDRSSP